MERVVIEKKLAIYLLSAVILVSTLATAIIWFNSKPIQRDNLLTVGIIASLTPAAIIDHLEMRRKRKIDERIPDFLREIAEKARSGMSFFKALKAASEKEYGPLQVELRRLVNQISWGMNPEEALKRFAARVGTPTSKKVVVFLQEVLKMGMTSAEILGMIGKYIRSLQLMEREKSSELKVHMLTIYITFAAFTFISTILLKSFFQPLYQATSNVGGIIAPIMTPLEAKQIFYHLILVEAVTSGLIIGKISEGRLIAGLKHIILLLAACLLAFNYI